MKCDDDRLLSLLADGLEGDVDPDMASHLNTCVPCQTKLLRLADHEQLSAELSQLYSSQPLEVPSSVSDSSRSIVIALDSSLAEDTLAVCEPVSLEFLAAPTHPEMLGRLDRYEIERMIGAGGMGIVLKGFDTELHRPVAIKVLAPHLAGSGAARSRFAREAQAAAAIVHEHVVPIHDVAVTRLATGQSRGRGTGSAGVDEGNFDGLPYLVMPFIAGQSLQARLDEQGHLPVKDVVRIAHQTALGLAAAHAQGIVHRDVKPANILLEGDVDRVRITDYGLARAADDASITRSGIIAGTPQYMSPEQARGESIDHRSDLFSLGSVVYIMCTGRVPFRAETTLGILRKISDEEPSSILDLNNEIPAWLAAVVRKLMAKSAEDRFPTAAAVAELLEQCLAHLHQPARIPLPAAVRSLPTSDPSRRLEFSRRSAAIVITASIVTASIVIALIVGSGLWRSHHLGETTTTDDASTMTESIAKHVQATPSAIPTNVSPPIKSEANTAPRPLSVDEISDQLDKIELEINQLRGEGLEQVTTE